MKIEITEELNEKINEWIKEGRYKNTKEFVNAAVETLLMAEQMKDSFTNSIMLDGRKDIAV